MNIIIKHKYKKDKCKYILFEAILFNIYLKSQSQTYKVSLKYNLIYG